MLGKKKVIDLISDEEDLFDDIEVQSKKENRKKKQALTILTNNGDRIGNNKTRVRKRTKTAVISQLFKHQVEKKMGRSEFNMTRTIDQDKKNASLWIDKYFPINVKELAVHPKKVEETRDWLLKSLVSPSLMDRTSPNLLILSGPPGTGKSTMIRILAKDLDVDIIEWNDSVSQIDSSFQRHRWQKQFDVQRRPQHEFPTEYRNQLDSFGQFMSQGKFNSLQFSKTLGNKNKGNQFSSLGPTAAKRLQFLLMEDIPQLFNQESSEHFQSHLNEFIETSSCPCVMIFSEATEAPEDSKTTLERLISKTILYSNRVKIIHCRPIAKTYMMKLLLRVAKSEHLKMSKNELEEVESISKGDVRHALMCLQFQQLKENKRLALNFSGGMHQRDSKHSNWHAIAKLLYCKRQQKRGFLQHHPEQTNPKVLEYVPEDVISSCDMDTDAVCCFMQYHCPHFFTDITQMSDCFDTMSDADLFLGRMYDPSKPREAGETVFPFEYAATLTSRSVCTSNRSPAEVGMYKMTAPEYFRIRRDQKDFRQKCKEGMSSFHRATGLGLKSGGKLGSDLIQFSRIIFDPFDCAENRLNKDIDKTLQKYFNYVNHQHQLLQSSNSSEATTSQQSEVIQQRSGVHCNLNETEDIEEF